MKRWGVLGAGGIAPSHIISLQRVQGVELVGVADIDAAARERVATNFGIATFPSIDALLEEGRPDAITIALPAQFHLSATRLAAEHGVHVLSEKPLADSVAAADDMLSACKAGGVGLGAILNNRGYAQTRWIKAQIDAGRWTPRLVSVRGAMAGSGSSAAGLVFAVGIHYLDLMRWWLGNPIEVGALVMDGVALAQIRFERALGSVRLAGVGRTSAGVKVDIEGDEGRVTIGRFGIESFEGDFGPPPEWDPEVEGMFFGAGHLTVIREAAEALERGDPFPVTGDEGRAAVAFCEAIVSASQSRRWEPVG